MDREKIIKELESLRDICNAKSNMAIGNGKIAWAGYANTADDAIALLEQKAVEARKKNDGKPQPWTCWWYVCGDCGQEIEYHDRFCRWCGRSVKWE